MRAWLLGRLEADERHLAEALARVLEGRSPARMDAELAKLRSPLLALLRGAVVASATPVVERMVRRLATVPSRAWVIDVLREAEDAMSPAERAAAGLDGLAETLASVLEAELASPERDRSDWSIEADLGCRCALCKQLGHFLASRDTRSSRWPLAKHGRMHVHNQIDGRELPVTHVTERRGRPYTLVLTKAEALFEREAARRKRIRADLRWLRGRVGASGTGLSNGRG